MTPLISVTNSEEASGVIPLASSIMISKEQAG